MQQHENNFKALFVVDDESNNSSSPSKDTPLDFKDNNLWNDGFFKVVNQTQVEKSYQEVDEQIREPVIRECEPFSRASAESQETAIRTPSHIEEDIYSQIQGFLAEIPEKENKRTGATPVLKKEKSKQKKKLHLLQLNTSVGNVHHTPPKALTFDEDE